jgi:Ca-activated chloride channel family protein
MLASSIFSPIDSIQDRTLFAAGQPQQPPIFKSVAGDLVVLPITVVDKRGELVAGLAAERFAVYDNNRRQPIALFSNEDTPVSIALVVDNSGSMRPKHGEVIAAALALAKGSRPEDEVRVIGFNDDVHDALDGRTLTAADLPELQTALEKLAPQGRTALYEGVLDGLSHLEQSHLPRKVVVLLSDGGDNASATRSGHVLERARRSDVTIYTIGLFDDDNGESNDRVLRRLAQTTGGERFRPRSPGYLISACRRIATEIRSGYTIGYAPPDRDGQFHKVRVEVQPRDPRGFVVRTKPGYFAASASER